VLAEIGFTEFLSAVAIVVGYVTCFALWWFVFRKGGDDER
jgi:nitrogen fixation-related uncharacterized protein